MTLEEKKAIWHAFSDKRCGCGSCKDDNDGKGRDITEPPTVASAMPTISLPAVVAMENKFHFTLWASYAMFFNPEAFFRGVQLLKKEAPAAVEHYELPMGSTIDELFAKMGFYGFQVRNLVNGSEYTVTGKDTVPANEHFPAVEIYEARYNKPPRFLVDYRMPTVGIAASLLPCDIPMFVLL